MHMIKLGLIKNRNNIFYKKENLISIYESL